MFATVLTTITTIWRPGFILQSAIAAVYENEAQSDQIKVTDDSFTIS